MVNLPCPAPATAWCRQVKSEVCVNASLKDTTNDIHFRRVYRTMWWGHSIKVAKQDSSTMLAQIESSLKLYCDCDNKSLIQEAVPSSILSVTLHISETDVQDSIMLCELWTYRLSLMNISSSGSLICLELPQGKRQSL